MKEKKKRNRLRILALLSLFFTIAMFIGYGATSLLRSETISKGYGVVKNVFKNIFNIEEPAPTLISMSYKKAYIFAGQKEKLTASADPFESDQRITFETSSDNCTVDDKGNIHYTGTSYEVISVYGTSVANPNIKNKCFIYGMGISPDDERIENLEIKLYTDSTFTTPADTNNIALNKRYFIGTHATIKDEYLEELKLTKETNRVRLRVYYKNLSDNPNIVFQSQTSNISFKEVGNYNFKLGLFASEEIVFDAQSDQISLTVKDLGNFLPSAIKPRFNIQYKSLTKISDTEYSVVFPAERTEFRITEDTNNYNPMFRTELVKINNGDVTKYTNGFARRTNKCEFDVKIISLLDDTISTLLHVSFVEEELKGFDVKTLNKISFFSESIFYDYTLDVKQDISRKINVSVISGNDIIEVQRSNGRLKSRPIEIKKLGKVTLRFELDEDPEIFVDKTIEVVFIDSLRIFVIKILGHLLSFFLIGLGLTFVTFLLFRPRKLSPLYTFVTVFLFSGLTELFQSPLFNNNRGSSLIDVLLNLSYGLTGMLVAFAIIFTYLGILKKKKPEKYKGLKERSKKLTIKSIWKKDKF